MIHALVLIAACAAQELQYPLLEKDPWAGFMPGSSVTRETNIGNRIRTETKLTLKSIEINSKTLAVLSQGEETEETVEFAAYSAGLIADGGGYKVSGKSTRVVPFGPAKLKALLRELSPEGDVASDVWRITTADDVPGGLWEATWSYEDEKTKSSVSYAFKGLDKVKVQGKDVACARFDVKETQGAKSKRSLEGSTWLSSQIPGLLVKSTVKITEGKDVTETSVQTLKFEVKK